MNEFDADDTHPVTNGTSLHSSQDEITRTKRTQPLAKTKPKDRRVKTSKNRRMLFMLAAFISLLIFFTVSGGLAGYMSGQRNRQAQESSLLQSSIEQQYEMGLADLANEQYELARQRFEYVLANDPSYPGAGENLTRVLLLLHTTATPTLEPPTATPEPTLDPRPSEELFSHAEDLLANQDWNATIETLISLRKANPSLNTARVDGMLFLALRYRGLEKILGENNLEGGIYDLALAENFGPLDFEASRARTWARIYIIGSSFWEVDPEQAVYYFSQVAAAAPYLRDASGWTATDRYRAALIQYGDKLIQQEDWCSAQVQYESAYTIRADNTLLVKIEQAALACNPPTETQTTWTVTPTTTGTITVTPTGTLITATPSPSMTATLPLPPSTATPMYTMTPSATQTLEPVTTTAPPPTATPSPTSESPNNPTPTP